METINLVEAGIDDLQEALSSGSLTSVDLVALYLRRISKYDCRNTVLNSIPILNTEIFQEAAASDDRRASGQPIRRLEGIPFTVKDSFKVKGMTVACGSPAFRHLIANEDAFTVSSIRAAGGVLIGKTNMPPMAYGGMQRGIYGRAESPYNPECLAAAFASGSSNGSGVSTAASFAAFGMGEETVSSGRSPASNNALVAYTPSRGWISIRGNWPLYPTCDVVVPHTRTMGDMLTLLEVITAHDESTEGDFWRDQPFVPIAAPWGGSPSAKVFQDISHSISLKGLRLAVPQMYIGGACPDWATPVIVSEGVTQVWKQAKLRLESLGAEIVEVPDFPVVTGYEHPELHKGAARLPGNWHWTERGPLIAHGWDLFLRGNKHADIPDLHSVDEYNIYPDSMRTAAELENFPKQNAIHWGKLSGYLKSIPGIYDIENLDDATVALESMRIQFADEYLERYKCDCFIFPAAGDVGAANADVDSKAAAHAWSNGVFYSNGNRALRHLGVPTVTVPMGVIPDKEMPIGLTFAGRAYDDENLLRWANAFERGTKMRTAPRHTPPLTSDDIPLVTKDDVGRPNRPVLEVTKCESIPETESELVRVEFEGSIRTDAVDGDEPPLLQITVDGEDVPDMQVLIHLTSGQSDSKEGNVYIFQGWAETKRPPKRNESGTGPAIVCSDQIMVAFLARSSPRGWPTGHLRLI